MKPRRALSTAFCTISSMGVSCFRIGSDLPCSGGGARGSGRAQPGTAAGARLRGSDTEIPRPAARFLCVSVVGRVQAPSPPSLESRSRSLP